jgi:hypothetical protein
MIDFYDLGYQDGAADLDPKPLVGGDDTPVAYNRKDYLAGWMLGQAMFLRAKRLGWKLDDEPPPPHRAPDATDELRGTGG